MTGNIHSIGMALQNAMRPEIACHQITFLIHGEESEVITASSPPIGHEEFTETGLVLATHDRVFYIDRCELEKIEEGFLPCIGQKVIDQSDGSRWKILPQDEHAWRYHGQNRTAIQIKTEQD